MADFVRATFLNQAAVAPLNDPADATVGGSPHDLRAFRRGLQTTQYRF